MTTLTIKFSGLQETALDRLVRSGVAESKSEAIRMALLSFAYEMHILDDVTVTEFLRKELSKNPRSPEEILAQLDRVKNETITR